MFAKVNSRETIHFLFYKKLIITKTERNKKVKKMESSQSEKMMKLKGWPGINPRNNQLENKNREGG